jgi:hypothetical protein
VSLKVGLRTGCTPKTAGRFALMGSSRCSENLGAKNNCDKWKIRSTVYPSKDA